MPNTNECEHHVGKCYWVADCSGSTEPTNPCCEPTELGLSNGFDCSFVGYDHPAKCADARHNTVSGQCAWNLDCNQTEACCEPNAYGLAAGHDCSTAGLQVEQKCNDERSGDMLMCQWDDDCSPVTTTGDGEDDCCIGATTADNAACMTWWAGFISQASIMTPTYPTPYSNPGLDYAGRCTAYNTIGSPNIVPNIDCTWNPNPVDPAVCDHPFAGGNPDPAADCCIPTEQNSGNNGYDCAIAGLQFNDKCTLPNTQNNCFWDTSNPSCTPEPQGCCEATEQNSGSGASFDCTTAGLNNQGKCDSERTQGNCQWNPACMVGVGLETLEFDMDLEALDRASVDLTVIKTTLATDLSVSADSIEVTFASESVSRRLIDMVPLGPDQETGGGGSGTPPRGISIPLGGMVVPIVIKIFGQVKFVRSKIQQEFGRQQFQRKFTSQVRVNLVLQIHRMGLAVQARC
jgi:hypothetical protein